MAAPEWLAVIEEEIIVCLNPQVLMQIEQDTLWLLNRQNINRQNISNKNIIYKLESRDLLQVLASSLGITPLSKGAIVIWTYYTDVPIKAQNAINSFAGLATNQAPILRTLMNVDGDISQKVCQDILQHPFSDRILQAHSFVIGQISQQLVTAIKTYLEAQLRPLVILIVSLITTFAWYEPFHNATKNLRFSSAIVNNFWIDAIILFLIVFILIWVINKLKLSFDFLESKFAKLIAIAAVLTVFLEWLIPSIKLLNNNLMIKIVAQISTYAHLYFPIAIISFRKFILDYLGKLLMKLPFLVKFIFGRFVR